MSAESDVVLGVRRRLYEQKGGEHAETCEVAEELARMVLESQLMFREAQATIGEQDMMLKGVGVL